MTDTVMSLVCIFLRLQKFINRLALAESILKNCPNSPSVYSERSLQRVASMASSAERGADAG